MHELFVLVSGCNSHVNLKLNTMYNEGSHIIYLIIRTFCSDFNCVTMTTIQTL